MAGVEKITEEILQEAASGAQALLGEAKKKAEAAAAKAREEAAQIVENGKKEAALALEQQEERAHSSAEMRVRQAMLSARQEVIDEIVGKAYEKLAGQGADEYFGMVVALLKKNIHAGEGVISFSKEDLKRLPEGFEKVAGKVAAQAGGSLKIDSTPAAIDNGFILKYGGIEENCSLKALFSQSREALRDSVASMLW